MFQRIICGIAALLLFGGEPVMAATGKWTFTGNVYRPTCTVTAPAAINAGVSKGSQDFDEKPIGTPLELHPGEIAVTACQNATAVTFTFDGAADLATGTLFKNTDTGASPSNVGIYLEDSDTHTQIPANGNGGNPAVSVNVASNAAVLHLNAGLARASNDRVTVGPVSASIVFSATYR
jgi:type 1 fimbria pilin